MKRYTSLVIVSLICLALFGTADSQAAESQRSGINVGARYHADHSKFTELPFDDGDISYLLGWEVQEGEGFVQLAVDYAPSAEGIETTDYVITPQINLAFVDKIIVGGLGILDSYISDDVTGGEWTDIYWQLHAGVRLPIGDVLQITVETFFPFESWGDIGDFEGSDLEYGAFLTYTF